METTWIRDIRLPLVVATLLAIAILSWEMNLSTLPKAQEDPLGSIFGVPETPAKPSKPKGTSKPREDFKGKTRVGG